MKGMSMRLSLCCAIVWLLTVLCGAASAQRERWHVSELNFTTDSDDVLSKRPLEDGEFFNSSSAQDRFKRAVKASPQAGAFFDIPASFFTNMCKREHARMITVSKGDDTPLYASCYDYALNIPLFVVHKYEVEAKRTHFGRPSAEWKTIKDLVNDDKSDLLKPKQTCEGNTFANVNGKNVYDRGHLAPNSDFFYDTNFESKSASFTVLNRAPQVSRYNQYSWRCVEIAVRNIANKLFQTNEHVANEVLTDIDSDGVLATKDDIDGWEAGSKKAGTENKPDEGTLDEIGGPQKEGWFLIITMVQPSDKATGEKGSGCQVNIPSLFGKIVMQVVPDPQSKVNKVTDMFALTLTNEIKETSLPFPSLFKYDENFPIKDYQDAILHSGIDLSALSNKHELIKRFEEELYLEKPGKGKEPRFRCIEVKNCYFGNGQLPVESNLLKRDFVFKHHDDKWTARLEGSSLAGNCPAECNQLQPIRVRNLVMRDVHDHFLTHYRPITADAHKADKIAKNIASYLNIKSTDESTFYIGHNQGVGKRQPLKEMGSNLDYCEEASAPNEDKAYTGTIYWGCVPGTAQVKTYFRENSWFENDRSTQTILKPCYICKEAPTVEPNANRRSTRNRETQIPQKNTDELMPDSDTDEEVEPKTPKRKSSSSKKKSKPDGDFHDPGVNQDDEVREDEEAQSDGNKKRQRTLNKQERQIEKKEEKKDGMGATPQPPARNPAERSCTGCPNCIPIS